MPEDIDLRSVQEMDADCSGVCRKCFVNILNVIEHEIIDFISSLGDK